MVAGKQPTSLTKNQKPWDLSKQIFGQFPSKKTASESSPARPFKKQGKKETYMFSSYATYPEAPLPLISRTTSRKSEERPVSFPDPGANTKEYDTHLLPLKPHKKRRTCYKKKNQPI